MVPNRGQNYGGWNEDFGNNEDVLFFSLDCVDKSRYCSLARMLKMCRYGDFRRKCCKSCTKFLQSTLSWFTELAQPHKTKLPLKQVNRSNPTEIPVTFQRELCRTIQLWAFSTTFSDDCMSMGDMSAHRERRKAQAVYAGYVMGTVEG